MLTDKEVLEQSKAAFSQWGEQWKKNAEINGNIMRVQGTSQRQILGIGKGKILLCLSCGSSFEKNIEKIKKYRDKYDIVINDKGFIPLLKNGIKPDYVTIADANVSYEKYCQEYIEQTKDIILIANICCNVKWTQNWKGKIFFYVNKDNIKSEEIYMNISGCKEIIPASSNVGNTTVVFASQILGYDKYLLMGYDFCWGMEENYYAFENSEKRYWMKNMTLLDFKGRLVDTSANLFFSFRWLLNYLPFARQSLGANVFNCSGQGLLEWNNASFDRIIELSKDYPRKLNTNEINAIKRLRAIREDNVSEERFNEIVKDNEIINVGVTYYNKKEYGYNIPA